MEMIFFIHDGLRRNLFLDLMNKAISNNNKVTMYCFSLAEYFWFRNHGMAKVVNIIRSEYSHTIPEALIESSVDYCAGFLDMVSAKKIYSSTYAILEKLKNNEEEIIVWGGNGLHIYDKAILEASNNNIKIRPLFTELSNIDGKLFIDPMGSNASSYYYHLLTSGLELSDLKKSFDVRKWKKNYVLHKKDNHVVQQTPEKKIFKLLVHRGVGMIEWVLRLPSYQRFKISDYLLNKRPLTRKIYSENWSEYFDDIRKIKEYIFFPMQVFGDSQIKLHSKIDNAKAIEIASMEAKKKGISLIVKPHPAETDTQALNTIVQLKEKYGFYLSNDNTFQLILNSSKVIVINSTVGLEAIFCEKEVDFLGDSFYSYLQDDGKLSYYLNEWLFDYDIFNKNNVALSDVLFKRILSRAKNVALK